MADYKKMILRHAKEANRLHDVLDAAVKNRSESQSGYEAWKKAAADFQNNRSNVDDWLSDIDEADISNWVEARNFVLQYLEIDAIYFRSGYVKETLLKKIKHLDLTADEARALRCVIIKRVQSGAMREFRRYCHLIPKIQNEAFIDELVQLTKVEDKSVKHRAKFAQQYLASESSE